MYILVTGAAGFIGSKVCEMLLALGHTVVGVDNLNEAYDIRLKHWRLDRLNQLCSPTFCFYQLDITDRVSLDALFHGQKIESFGTQQLHTNHHFDAVINLAARAGVRTSIENPRIFYETNLTGTLNLLENCRVTQVPKFVLASTSSLYGINSSLPYCEDINTNYPLSPYAASKKAAEVLCATYHHLYGLDVTVFRYFTVYGPSGRPDMSLFRFVQWVSEGQPVTIYGDGMQSRDFTYIDDIARGTIAGLKSLGYAVINLGCNKPIVLIDALRMVEDFVGRSARVVLKPAHPADVPATWADITRARELLGWEPLVHPDQGIEQLVRWYQSERAWARTIDTRSS